MNYSGPSKHPKVEMTRPLTVEQTGRLLMRLNGPVTVGEVITVDSRAYRVTQAKPLDGGRVVQCVLAVI